MEYSIQVSSQKPDFEIAVALTWDVTLKDPNLNWEGRGFMVSPGSSALISSHKGADNDTNPYEKQRLSKNCNLTERIRAEHVSYHFNLKTNLRQQKEHVDSGPAGYIVGDEALA